MHSKSRRARTTFCLLFVSLFAFNFAVFAQNTSGSITGVVQDASGAVIPGAQVKLINQEQGTVRETITNEAGIYLFSALPAATYTVSAELPGFKTYKKPDVKLFVNDRMGLPPIILEVGSQNESVTVEAQTVQLETVTAERSGVVTGRQILDIALNGRDFTRLLKTVPGAPADAVSGSTTFNGQRANQNNFTVDGQTVTDSGVNQQFAYRISMDAIAEFKVSTTSQTAEFGRNSGAQVQVASKSGTSEFHGGGYWFKRHEGWNANSFTNNRQGTPRQIYRFLTAGYNFGGPIKKDKAFFFFSHEWGRSKTPPAPRRITVPTEAERRGDFSQTVDGAGVPVVIKDPTTLQPFQGNLIPSNRITTLGAQVLAWMPKPNVSGQLLYNYESQVASELPSFDQLYRVDYNINTKNRAYVRIINSKQTQNNPYGRADSANNLALNALSAPTFGWSVSVNLATIINPTLTNELQVGKAKNGIPGDAPPEGSLYYRKNANITIPLLYPNADPSGLIPNFNFGGVPNGLAPGTSTQVTTFAGLPYYNANPITNVTDNISKVLGRHTLKFGGFVEYAIKHESPFRPYNATISFDRDSANPGDTGWAFSNALLGNFTQYQQWSKLLIEDAPYWNYEFFAQDSWKATRNLTLNYGLRVNFVPPLYEKNNLFTNFDDAAFDPAKKVVLYQPTQVGPNRMARNPITGEIAPAVLIGAIVPGVGDPANGIVHAGKNGTPRGLIENRGPQWGPRLGLAYTVDDKTVFRAGGGMFYERIATSAVGYTTNFLTNPPDVQLSQMYYGNLADIGSSPGALFPLQVTQLAKDGHVPTTYNFNAGIQRELPMRILLDVSYVGTQSRHLIEFSPFNALPFGSAWLPQNQDPTKAVNLDGSNALPPNLYRPYPGYAGGRVTVGQSAQAKYAFGGSSNYNALQISANRRAGSGLQVGANYTWSRALGTTDAHLTNTRGVNYGLLALDRSHGLTFNYIYDIPNLATKLSALDKPVTRQIFGGWQLSGLSSFSVGAPQTPTYTLTNASGAALNRLITGSEDFAPRVVLTCDPNKSRGDRTIGAYINTNCFAPAPKGSIGNDSGINTVRGPGLNNWDMSLFKKIQYGEGNRVIQLRVEAYNVFNHTNWTTLNTAAQFNPTTGALVNAANPITNRDGFGALTAVRAAGQPGSPRIIQLAGKIYF
jgi:carboxypeptidase family protein/TonB-dependent receptor-like protein